MIKDTHNRNFKKLRVSLTHECNYACIYCTDNSHHESVVKSDEIVTTAKILTADQLLTVIQQLHATLHLQAVRLTGGEPLLHPKLEYIISHVQQMGISNIGMTTNGHLLFKKIDALKTAGLSSVNISLDALSPDTFRIMSRNAGLNNVLRSITASLAQNIDVKINTVVVAGKNDHEILPLLNFAMEHNIVIRFLELMSMGPLHHDRHNLFFSQHQILQRIESKYNVTRLPHDSSATANYWAINGQKAFGIIANDSSPFCADCNRLRLDSYGNIYGCLSSLIPIPISNIDEKELMPALQKAMTHKQQTHFTGNQRTMQSIGG